MRKLLPPILFFFSGGLMVLLHIVWPGSRLDLQPYTYFVGATFVAGGLALAALGSRQFSRVGTNIKTFNQPDVLVTDGVFRFSRNPMYLGFILALAGLGCLLGSASPFAIVVAFLIITDRWYIRFEERMMLKTFGEDYVTYKATTSRWV